MSFFNPFAELNESKLYPNARTLRTSFTQKMYDTFGVFFGSFNIRPDKHLIKSKKYHLGLLDVLALGIPYIVTFLPFWIGRNTNSSLLKLPTMITSLVLLLPRAIVAGVLTLACIPFIALAQAITNNLSSKTKGRINNYTTPTLINGKQTIAAILNSKNQTIETIERVNIEFIPPRNEMPLGSMALKLLCDKQRETFTIYMKTDRNCNLTNKADQKFFKALKELNIGDINETLNPTPSRQ